MRSYFLNNTNTLVFSTKGIQQQERFDYWNDVVCKQIVNVECNRTCQSDSFDGTLNVNQTSDIQVSEIHCNPCTFRRTKQNLSKNIKDSLLLTMRLKNSCSKFLNRDDYIVSSGDISIYHCGREQTLGIRGNVDALLMQVPLDRIGQIRSGAEDLNGIFLHYHEPVVGILSNHMKHIVKQISEIEPYMVDRIIDNFLRLLIIAIEGGHTKNILMSTEIKPILLSEIIDFILFNLDRQELSPRYIAEQKKISLRYLYTIFDLHERSPCEFIREERLNAIANSLANNRKARISDIAYKFGFNQISHFSRAFKKKFGMTPKDYRESMTTAQS